MPLSAVPPGARKGNKHWIFRGTVNGREREIATRFRADTPARAIQKALAAAERTLLAEDERRRLPGPGEALSFARAAELYIDFRDPSRADRIRIDKLKTRLGRIAVADMRQVDLVEAAIALYPTGLAATRNREAMRPAAAILHYAADSGYCAWLRVKLFREPRPKTRAVSAELAAELVAGAPEGPKRLFLLWSFKQGTRISDTLRVDWEAIDLAGQSVTIHVRKTDRVRVFPLDPEVFEALAAIPREERAGRLFPWHQKTGVYRWLRPLVAELGVRFTPHMARHSLGTWLNAAGEGLRTIMETLGQDDPKSAARYTAADIEIIRAAIAKVPAIGRRA